MHQQREQRVYYPVEIYTDYKESSLPKRPRFVERQVLTIKMLINRCDGDVPVTRLLYLRSGQHTPTTRHHHMQNFYTMGSWKTTFLDIIKPPYNSEVLRASLQAKQHYSRHDTHSKEKSNLHLLPTQPITMQATSGGRWSQGMVKFKAETPNHVCGPNAIRRIWKKQGTIVVSHNTYHSSSQYYH